MKSGKQRRIEIKSKRRKNAESQKDIDRLDINQKPKNAVIANSECLVHNHSYRLLPLFYVDMPFVCKDCGSSELWTAKQQKWWYEIAKGSIDTIAVRCRSCRKVEYSRKVEARKIHLDGLSKKRKLL